MPKKQSFATILVGKSVLRREGLARILHAPNFRIVFSVSCVDELPPSELQSESRLFLIVHTGDDFDAAIKQIEDIRSRDPAGRIALVADRYRLVELVSALRAGANGYFVDVMTCDIFVKSIELVMMGETIYPPAFLSFVIYPHFSTRRHLATSRGRCPSRPKTLSSRRTALLRRSFPHDGKYSLTYDAWSRVTSINASRERLISRRQP